MRLPNSAALEERERPRRSKRRVVLAAAFIALACSVGSGTGEATGEVHLPDCGVESTAYSLAPNFFAAEFIEDPTTRTPGGAQRLVILRMQRTGYRESDTDGIRILLRDVNDIQTSLLGVPIEVGTAADSMALMTLYLNQSCLAGFPRDFWTVPGVLQAVSGTLVLDSVHAPGLPDVPGGDDAGLFAGAFTDVRFIDASAPDERFAVLSGSFSFLYQRGRPAQRFP